MKPKAIGYILLSYFQQPFFNTLTTVIAIIILVVASFIAAINPETAGKIESIRLAFLVALMMILFVSGLHWRGLIRNNATALFPHYRRYLIATFVLILAAFLLWPVIITGLRGFTVLPMLAMFMFLACIMLPGFFFFGESIFVMGVLVWLGKMAHELLGFKARIMIFDDLSNFSLLGSKLAFPILLILFSSIGLFLFARYLLQAPTQFSNVNMNKTNSYAQNYDQANALTLFITRKSMAFLLKNSRNKKRSLFNTARLLQPALFSPRYAFFCQSLAEMPVLFFYLLTAAYIMVGIKFDTQFVPFLFSFYYITATIITTDFLQHRQRLSLIWVQVQVDSRKTFAKITILTYMMVLVKNYLAYSLGLLFIPLIFPMVSIIRFLPIIALGLLVNVLLLSLSLLFSDQVVSPDSKGWMLFHIIVGFAGSLIAITELKLTFNTPGTWIFILVLAVITGFLLLWAYKNWSKTELNFAGPKV